MLLCTPTVERHLGDSLRPAPHPIPGVILNAIYNPRSPGTHIVGPWVIDSIRVYRDLKTGTQYVGIWASRVIVNASARPPRLAGLPTVGTCKYRYTGI